MNRSHHLYLSLPLLMKYFTTVTYEIEVWPYLLEQCFHYGTNRVKL
uniref:Uncharacterized protein n=1 Tax=Arundo donax TaxID=35708 RepID=A0A0A8ZCM5_ARUDO